MILSERAFEELLPSYLHDLSKNRIRNALSQFSKEGAIDYSDFYSSKKQSFLMQSDLLHSVQGIMWNEDSGNVESAYNPAMLISNSCDITLENIRSINKKDALFAPVTLLEEYVDDCRKNDINEQQIASFLTTLKRQEYSNLFYLPPNQINGREYYVRLDRIYWTPISFLQTAMSDLHEARFISLSHWAWYLFIVKISLHICRVPETVERFD